MSTAETVTCTSCGDRQVELCCFCDERCGHELCYQCVLFGLREDLPQPHTHGG